MSISRPEEKSKFNITGGLVSSISRLVVPCIIILVGLGAFGLGRLSNISSHREPISIEYATSTPAAAVLGTTNVVKPDILKESPKVPSTETTSTVKNFVASKNGKNYYLPVCSAAKNLKEANKVWFETKEAAEKAGYKPATNCKEMKNL